MKCTIESICDHETIMITAANSLCTDPCFDLSCISSNGLFLKQGFFVCLFLMHLAVASFCSFVSLDWEALVMGCFITVNCKHVNIILCTRSDGKSE